MPFTRVTTVIMFGRTRSTALLDKPCVELPQWHILALGLPKQGRSLPRTGSARLRMCVAQMPSRRRAYGSARSRTSLPKNACGMEEACDSSDSFSRTQVSVRSNNCAQVRDFGQAPSTHSSK